LSEGFNGIIFSQGSHFFASIAFPVKKPSHHQKRIFTVMKKVFEAVLNYLKDWKNLLSHAVVGVLILVVGLSLPILPIYRIGILVLIIALNVFRMRLSGKKVEVFD
jgi:hypothetical protein